MRILQINNCHYRRGGADVVYLNTGELLEKFGHEVYYFSQENVKNIECKTKEYFIEPIDFLNKSFIQKILISPRFFYSSAAANKLNILLTKLKPEIAHIHTYKGTLTPSILKTLKKHSIPVIISLHDYGFLCPHNLMLDGKMNICERCIKRHPLNCIVHKCNRNNRILSMVSSFEFLYHKSIFPFETYFNAIVAVSKFGQNIHNQSKKFINKVIHLYNFYPDLVNTKTNKNAGDYFLFFGRLSKEKGTMSLLKAWLKKKRKTKLKIVGTGELFEELTKLSISESSIEILGFKQGKDLDDLIKHASFIIVPSEWYENNPLTIIEAYASGKPVIGANVGGIPEIIENGKTGFLFEMKNVNDLSDKISMAEEMSEKEYGIFSDNARKFAEIHFNPDTHYNELIKIYQETINSCNNVEK